MIHRSLLLAACGLLLLSAAGRGEEYRDAAKHFKLSLPDDWTTIDPVFVAQVNQMAKERMPDRQVRYETGFQLRGKQSGELPHILVQWHAGAPPSSYEAIERSFNQGRLTEAKEAERAFDELISNVSLGVFVVDRNRNRVQIRTQSDIADVGRIENLSVGFLGKDGMLDLHCYDHAGDFPSSLPTFNKILDTFQYDTGYAYEPGRSFDWHLGYALGQIIGYVGVAALFVFILKKMKAIDRIW